MIGIYVCPSRLFLFTPTTFYAIETHNERMRYRKEMAYSSAAVEECKTTQEKYLVGLVHTVED